MKQIQQLVHEEAGKEHFKSFRSVYQAGRQRKIRRIVMFILIIIVVILFLPWTQNIRARGTVTTLRQEDRPQELNTIIGGRIIKWWVKEGDFVNKGDTIAQLAEIKDSYLDPNLLERTREQLTAKTQSVASYNDKARAAGSQIDAMQQARELKIEQLKNKLRQLELKIYSDSMEAVAATNEFNIATEQFRRQRIMRDSGLVSQLQLEQRNQAYQNAIAKRVSADIKFTNTKTDLINTRIELNQVEQEYAEKIFKTRGDLAAAQSEIAAGEGEIAKLSNEYANYAIRSGQYFLLAPQSGQIVQASKAGINEIVKEGDKLVTIVPATAEHAVEMYVRPVDLPLLSRGQKVRLVFDGFPAIVFSGWPQASYGLFSGEVVAVENAVNANGKFRVLIAEDKKDKPWPQLLRIGAGTQGIALLKNVPVWYELWRNINGFPPDYYQSQSTKGSDQAYEKK